MHYCSKNDLQNALLKSQKLGKVTFDLHCEFINITHRKLITTLGRLISDDEYSGYVGYTMYYLEKHYHYYKPKKDLNPYAYIIEIAKRGMIDYHNMLKYNKN